MLDKDPSKRPTAVELTEHPWFHPADDDQEEDSKKDEVGNKENIEKE